MSDRQVLLHIGPHKTATTWLQTRVFPRLAASRVAFDLPEIRRRIIFADDLEVEKLRERAFQDADEDTLTIISDERLAGAPLGGGYDRLLLADRLHQCFPEAKVLITAREQVRAISSLYRHHILWNNGLGSPEQFLQERAAVQTSSFSLSFYDYEQLRALYAARFGAERVFLLPIELKRSKRFLPELRQITGREVHETGDDQRVNVGIHAALVPAMRWVNALTRPTDRDLERTSGGFPLLGLPGRQTTRKLIRRLGIQLDRRGYKSPQLHQTIEALVGDRFASSNRRLTEATPYDFAALGYTS